MKAPYLSARCSSVSEHQGLRPPLLHHTDAVAADADEDDDDGDDDAGCCGRQAAGRARLKLPLALKCSETAQSSSPVLHSKTDGNVGFTRVRRVAFRLKRQTPTHNLPTVKCRPFFVCHLYRA